MNITGLVSNIVRFLWPVGGGKRGTASAACIIFAALWAVSISVSGAFEKGTENAAILHLSLERALDTALSSNPSLRQVEAEKERASAGVASAISAFLPKLDLDFSLSRSNNPVYVFGSKLNQAAFTMQDFELDNLNAPDYRTNWNTRFRLVQPIFNRGQEYIGYKVATAMEGMASIRKKGAVQGVLFNVEQAYFQVLLAKEAMGVMDAAVKTAVEHERLAEKRHRAGLVLKSDVLSAIVQRTDMERQRLDARNQYKMAIAALNRAMGVDQGSQWELQQVELPSDARDDELSWWIETAREHRPELNLSRKKLEVADFHKKGAQLNYLPAVNFMGMYEQDTNSLDRFGGDSWTFMATATFNIFNGLGDSAGLRAASAERKAAEEELKSAESGIELEVRQAFYSYQTALKQLEVARAAVEQAEESMRIIKNRYNSGMALMVELLSADTMLKDQRLKRARARYDALLSKARLELSAGILGSDAGSSRSAQENVAASKE